MNRTLPKLAAALLVGSSLAACSTFDGAQTSSRTKDADGSAPRLTTSPKSMAAGLDVQINDAVALRGKGDYAGATKILSQLLLVAPDNARIIGEYGKNLVQQGRSKEALDFLRRAVQLQPGDWSLYSALGIAYDQSGDYANAKLAYQQALTIKPGDAGVLNNYALSRMQANDLSSARQLMAQASASGGADPKIAQNAALLASLAPPQIKAQASPAAAKSTATQQATAKPTTTYAPPPPKNMGPNVVMQSVPKDSLAGPVRQATSAPRKLAQDGPDSKKPAAPPLVKAAAPATQKSVQTAASKPAAKKADANKTPALRMTADAASP
jgi:Flp pilus assembly protein TadD